MQSNKSVMCFIITICFSINGLFAESTKNLNLKEVEKLKQYVQNIQPAEYFIGHSNDYSNECYDLNEEDCNSTDQCWWNNATGECIEDNGTPDCLSDCEGIENLDGDSPMQVCALLDSVWAEADSCADDCENDEAYMELNMIAYLCQGCYDADNLDDTTCVDWFDFGDADPCSDCHDDCYDVGGGDEGDCHDDCDENECGCEDDDPCCQCHETCHNSLQDCKENCGENDNSCIEACDNDVDTCNDNCDQDACGPPACLSECEGVDDIDPKENPSGFCTWLVDADTNIANCNDGCDDELLTEFDMMAWMCTGCLEEDPDGTMGTCGYWLEFDDDECDNCHDDCHENDDSNECHDICNNDYCDGDDDGDGGDCDYLYNEEDCNNTDQCWWDSEAGESGECVEDDGPPECILDCPGIGYLGSGSGLAESCAFFTSISDHSCTDDCGQEESGMFIMVNFLCAIYDACIEDGYSETECVLIIDGNDPCSDCHDDCYDVGGGDEGDCHNDCDENECGCEDGDLCCQCHETCHNSLQDCKENCGENDNSCIEACDNDVDTCNDNCDEGDCAGEDGPPECMLNCPDIDTLESDEPGIESCATITAIYDGTCADDCGMEESMTLIMLDVICEMYDECHADCEEGDDDYEDECHADCEELFDMDDGGDSGGEDGPPECIMDCAGIESVDPDADPTAFCDWIVPTLDTGCAANCDAEVMTDLTDMLDVCTDCINEGNCDEADLSTDEKNLLLPEEFALHLVYPNPFNPITDIGFSLELAGPVSISVYDVTGRQMATILQNDFRNAGSHIISWNGSQYPSGIYFIHLQAGRQVDIQKVTLLK